MFDCPSIDAECSATASCELSCTALPPATITPEPAGLPQQNWTSGAAVVVDLSACIQRRWFAALPLGSAWVAVSPNGEYCDVWVGGETENPIYDGSPTQQCRFRRDVGCELQIEQPAPGGPVVVDSPACVGL